MDTPAAEVQLDEALITRLVGEQHPDLAGPVRIVASGWDNVVARLGDDLSVRLPRRAMAAPLVENEARWLPVLAPLLSVPIPEPVRVGRPARDYPWTWVITPWFEGVAVTELPVARRRQIAGELGAAQSPLHVCAAIEAPVNPLRGVPLADRAEAFREQIPRVERGDELLMVFEEGLAAQPWEGPEVWVHGDPHPGNLLAQADDRLAAVLDFGDLTAGDPATDLAIAWLAFDAEGRDAYKAAHYPVDDATWLRARAWAAGLTSAFLLFSDDNPAMAEIGRHGLAEVLSGT